MRRSTIFVALVAAALMIFGAAGSASAQTSRGGGVGQEANPECFCTDNDTDTGESCVQDQLCVGLTDCTAGGQDDCAAGEICIDAANGCGMAVCSSECPHDLPCGDTHVFGAGPPFFSCPQRNQPYLVYESGFDFAGLVEPATAKRLEKVLPD